MSKLISQFRREHAEFGAAEDQAAALLLAWEAEHRHSLGTIREREALAWFDVNREPLTASVFLLSRISDPAGIPPGLLVARFLIRKGKRHDPEVAGAILRGLLPLIAAQGSPPQLVEAAQLLSRVLRYSSRGEALHALEAAQGMALDENLDEVFSRLSFEKAKLQINYWLDPSIPHDPRLVPEVEHGLRHSATARDQVFGGRWLGDLYCRTGRLHDGLALLEEVRQKAHDACSRNEEGYAIRSQVYFQIDGASRAEARWLADECAQALSLMEGRASPHGVAATLRVHARALTRAGSEGAATEVRSQAEALVRSVAPQPFGKVAG